MLAACFKVLQRDRGADASHASGAWCHGPHAADAPSPAQLAPTTALVLQARSVMVDMEEGVINKMLKVQLPHQGNLRA